MTGSTGPQGYTGPQGNINFSDDNVWTGVNTFNGLVTTSTFKTAGTMYNVLTNANFVGTQTLVYNTNMPTYILHNRSQTTACTITLSPSTYCESGQYLVIKKVNAAYTLTITAGSGTTFQLTNNTSASSIINNNFATSSFIYYSAVWYQLYP
jgi:hypothetical protein